MMLSARFKRLVTAAICGLTLCGCFPPGSGGLEEEREPHYLTGKSRVSAMDYRGAIESFEKALEANPRSASAHFELGCLLTERESDPAAAIYHYEQYLKLRPNAENTDIIRQRIQVLKQDLAKNVLPPSATPALQREFEQLAEDNRRLRAEVEKWRAYYASRGTNVAPQTTATAIGGGERVTQPQNPAGAQNTTVSSGPSAAAPRTHKVRRDDTPSSIARKYGVKLDALMAANPGLIPTKLRVGQTLNVPAS